MHVGIGRRYVGEGKNMSGTCEEYAMTGGATFDGQHVVVLVLNDLISSNVLKCGII